ncbi:HAD family hydrolase [Maribellus sp. CM-23]|uniref:HAD family hydrolase n=1 Tax=Maribellus sp. CM-23 TaxID=2781026 RepID=UPI001F31B3A7|nr:HAD hydrolase-like protein [Maribellus sp. CM-23]MCE4566283.1 HAD family hydrolase [Maribellus sp. CM-23]
MRSVIWDWNGTLLNDLDFCISTINQLLEKRGLNLLDHVQYKDVFSFPVKDYYTTIGFDFSKEDFSIPAREFIDLYNNGVKNCDLHSQTHAVLDFFKNSRKRQFVLSAMQQNMLHETLDHQNILNYFEGIAGLNDHYAASKIERGEQLIELYQIRKENAVMIGDTIHDYEVAEKLGITCILIANGHQSKERLESTGAFVADKLEDLMDPEFLRLLP